MSSCLLQVIAMLFLVLLILFPIVQPYSKTGKFFFSLPNFSSKPSELVLISGCTGVGKSTFGMTIAIDRGIIRCVSSDTVRQILRMYSQDQAVLRPSYGGIGDPIAQWRECCTALESSLNNIVDDALFRGYSLVLEGVHIVPSNHLLQKWRDAGGAAIGVVLSLPSEDEHKQILLDRGTRVLGNTCQQVNSFDRIRKIQNEVVRLGRESNWEIIERTFETDPLELIGSRLET